MGFNMKEIFVAWSVVLPAACAGSQSTKLSDAATTPLSDLHIGQAASA